MEYPDLSKPIDQYPDLSKPMNAHVNEPPESFGTSLARAIPRIGEDALSGIYNFVRNIPGYAEKAKTEVPGLQKLFQEHPLHAAGQGIAGLAEMGQNVFNLPHDVFKYGTERLHLLPEEINKHVQMARMPESSEQINQTFGKPIYPGEELLRGALKESIPLMTAGRVGHTLNPTRLTTNSMVRNIVQEGQHQIERHSNMYNDLWRNADRRGYNQVPTSGHLINTNLNFIRQYKTPREYLSLEHFSNHPTLPNAQSALTDLRTMQRKLEETSRSKALTGEERHLYDALQNTERHIENNMFRDAQGNIHHGLANRYRYITNSYRENVVPYRYNKDIQAFMNQELTAKELIPRLKQGEFAAKKGHEHPELWRSEAFRKGLTNLGILGGLYAGGTTGYKYLTGSHE